MLRSKILFLCVAVNVCVSVAASLTPKQALEKFRMNHSQKKSLINSVNDLIYTATSEGKPSFYIYSNSKDKNGFVILSANACEDVLIGYSSSGTFDTNNIPEALRCILNGCHAINFPYSVEGKKAIAPMLTTRWNQNEPYSNTLPAPYGKPSVAGCVATAMAQIINYHRFPIHPTGTVEYTSVLWHYSVDFNEYAFDYNNMIDDYQQGNPTDEQIKAVNDLYYCCGMSVDSDWGSDVTTAKSSLVPERMKRHFGYSEASGCVSSSFYTAEEWADLIYAQLEKGLPVIISANHGDESTGHEFICDGYDGNGYYHINWGWGGNLDGFFNLTSLYSYNPDIDFSSEGFGKNQNVIVNICPEERMESPMEIFTATAFSLPNTSFDLGERINVTCHFQQCAGLKTPVKLGLKFTDVATGKTVFAQSTNVNTYDKGIVSWEWQQNLPEEIDEGTFKVSPAVYICEDDEWLDIHVKVDVNRYYFAEVCDSKVTFIKPTNEGNVTLQNALYPEMLFPKRIFSASADLVNDSESDYTANIALCVCTKKDDGTYRVRSKSPSVFVKVGQGETRSVFLSGKLDNIGIRDDLYIGFMYENKNFADQWIPIGEPETIPMNEYTPGTLAIDEVSIVKESEPSNPTITINTVFHCENGYYNGNIFMDLVECDENGELLELTEGDEFNNEQLPETANVMKVSSSNDTNSKKPQSPTITVGHNPYPVKISRTVEGKAKEYNPDTSFPRPNRWYRPRYHYYSSSGNELLYLLANLIVGVWLWDTLDVPDIPINTDISKGCTYYNINGTMMPTKPTSSGIYIKTTNDGNILKTQKIIVR